MMDLLIGFLKVGCFTFGGAYSAIPLIRDIVLSYGWLTDEQLSHMIAATREARVAEMQAILRGVKPCMVGVILATGVYMTAKACLTAGGMVAINVNACLIALLLFAAISLSKKKMKKKLSAIQLIVLSAVLGILFY